MANSILTPGYDDEVSTVSESTTDEQYLKIDNYLSEYDTDEKKSVVRENLNIYSKDNLYDKDEVDIAISEQVSDALNNLLLLDDPYGIIPQVKEMISDMVVTDGSTPFTAPQTGVDPTSDYHLATMKYVQSVLKEHLKADDPHGILDQVATILEKYVLKDNVYTTSDVYTKSETDTLLKGMVKSDGSVAFTNAQVGADPQLDSHLATKRYVDKVLYKHLVDVDPHGFLTVINNKLAYYAKSSNVYDKSQTYSRSQVDSLITGLVATAVASSIADYQESTDDKIQEIKDAKYVKSDGTISFKSPQVGVDAEEDNQLTTLSQVNSLIATVSSRVDDATEELTWITSGPTEATVGLLEEGTEVPDTMTFQEVCDAIFYGKTLTADIPDYVTIGETADILICVHGSTSLLSYVEVLKDGEQIAILTADDFEDGCVTVTTDTITEDCDIIVNAVYSNGATLSESGTIKVSYPVFVGLLPKWKFGTNVTMDYLEELENEDTDGTQNRFITVGDNVTEISFYYEFEDTDLRHPFIVIPQSYPDLVSLTTDTLKFGVEAFDVINSITLNVSGQDVVYKEYIFTQALSNLSQEVKYNFV